MSIVLAAAALTVSCPPPPPLETVVTALAPGQRAEALKTQVEIIRAAGRLDAAKTGYGGDASDSYRAFEALLEVAEDADLELLLSDRAPAVRLYATWGLLKRGHAPAPLLARLPGKGEKVESQAGCRVSQGTVAEYAERLAQGRF